MAKAETLTSLNKEQKKAVTTTEGPVMVIAGPGTGKTEILSRRIAYILEQGLTPPSGILALTFTNSGVKAMRQRLLKLVGPLSSQINISTFHSFGTSLIQEFYEDLSLNRPPVLLDDKDRVMLFDELLETHDWEYLRLRSGGAHNFDDLKSLISFLKQERMSPTQFIGEVEVEIERIKNDPASISTRGESKGEMKAVERGKIERLARTLEAGRFYELYESVKKERGLADYDDILENIVKLVKVSEDAKASIRERFLYILVDEHQDSSGVQNEFLEEVWAGVEQPNIFVVGDDRQLIYGFGGASLSHFERFQEVFQTTELIALKENHRSTQDILDLAGTLLQSSLTKESLVSMTKDSNPISLVEAEYPRDEVLLAGIEMKKKIEKGLSPDECALIVPKNSQVKSATVVLEDLGLSVAKGKKFSLFSMPETRSMLRLLHAVASPFDTLALSEFILDPRSSIFFADSQRFLRNNARSITLDTLLLEGGKFKGLGELLQSMTNLSAEKDVYEMIQIAGEKLFFQEADSHEALVREIEVVRTLLHLALRELERDHKLTLKSFLSTLERLEEYKQDIPVAVFGADDGVKVMTLHSSKGREFEYVWIAHLDESSLMRGKQMGITLPEHLKEKLSKKDELTARRELYVGITRAKRHCTLSYSTTGYTGGDQALAKIVAELPEDLLKKKTQKETEKEIMANDGMAYVSSIKKEVDVDTKEVMINLVKAEFNTRPLAVTHLNNFFSCPWKWYFRNFLSLPEALSESLQFGNLMHGAIEKLIKDPSRSEDIEQILSEGLLFQQIYNERLIERFRKTGSSVLKQFIENDLEKFASAKSESKASNYRDPEIPEIEVGGKVDVVETLSDGSVVVTDFKTGSVKGVRDIEKMTEDGRMSDMLRQLAMYSYLLENGRTKEKVSLSRLLFLEAEPLDKNRIYEKKVGMEEISMLRKDIKDYVRLLSTGEWTEMECNFKPFGTTKECEYCRLARDLR